MAQPQRFITSIFYYVPEDNEDGIELNAFPVYKKMEDVRLTDIQDNFPLPGTYHFRFQHFYNSKMLVWLDLNNEKWQLPQVENQIIVKALRLSWKSDKSSSNSTGKKAPDQKPQRHSEPEEHKDLDDLLSGMDGQNIGANSDNRNSYAHQQYDNPGLNDDPFQGIDASMF